jgi:hypothetical protein
MNNNRINNMQRKIFSRLAEETLEQKLQQARDDSGELVAEITEQVKRELGVDTIDNQIQALERQIMTLKEQKESLGFLSWRDDNLKLGSKAKQLIDNRTSSASQNIQALEAKRTEVIAQIWASQSLDEAMAILDQVRSL